MSVHYSPQQQVLRNISVGKTPITVNVSSVEHGGDYTVHNGQSAVQYPVIGETVNNCKEDAPNAVPPLAKASGYHPISDESVLRLSSMDVSFSVYNIKTKQFTTY